jgi:hypothetical protein
MARLGIALGADRIWAVPLKRNGTAVNAADYVTRSLDGLSAAELRKAFEGMQEELGISAVVAHVAVLPTLAQARRLELPRLKPDELRGVLARSASKYFFGARERQVVGAGTLPSAQRSPVTVFASAAAASVVDAILDAAEQVEWRVASVVPAYHAWAAALRAPLRKAGRKAGWLVLCGADTVELMSVSKGSPQLVRRVRSGGQVAVHVTEVLRDAQRAAGATKEPAAVIGSTDFREELLAGLESAGIGRLRIADEEVVNAAEPLAAAYAARADRTELLPERVHVARRRSARRLAAALSSAAVVLFIVAAGLELLGAQRELNAVMNQRDAIRSEVDLAMGGRDALLGINDRLAILSSLEETAPRWAGVMSAVAEYLPDDAYLTAFRAQGDSLVLEGVADRAADVFQAMQSAPVVVGVRAQAPIRRELRDGEQPVERFTLGARLGGAIDEERER